MTRAGSAAGAAELRNRARELRRNSASSGQRQCDKHGYCQRIFGCKHRWKILPVRLHTSQLHVMCTVPTNDPNCKFSFLSSCDHRSEEPASPIAAIIYRHLETLTY